MLKGNISKVYFHKCLKFRNESDDYLHLVKIFEHA